MENNDFVDKSFSKQTNHDTKSGRIVTAIFLSLAFSFNIFIFAPVDSYYSGRSEFWFGITTLLPVIIPVFLLSMLICLAVTLFMPKKLKPYIFALFMASTVALYVQGNFLTNGYPTLDGADIPWNTMISKGIINTIIWLFIFAAFLALAIFKKQVINTLSKAVSIIIVGIELVTVLTVSFSSAAYSSNTASFINT